MFILTRGNLRTFVIIFGILFMSYNAELFNIGAAIFFAGLIMHFLSKGFLYRNEELAVRGPYSFFRHPFYIANLLLDTGIIMMCGHPIFTLIYLPLYFKSYHRVILQEERYLINRYGEVYRNYMKSIPRYIPKIIPYTHDCSNGFLWKNILREREISRFLRLVTYPISFLIIHEIVKYKLCPEKFVQMFFGISLILILLFISHLFYNKIERTSEQICYS